MDIMKYVEMTIEEALAYNKGNKKSIVLVAVKNLKDQENDEIQSFVKRTKGDCATIIKEAETIALACDDFMNMMKCFSAKQDLRHIRPVGKVSTILMEGRQ